jgi:2-aminoadipate transaminase
MEYTFSDNIKNQKPSVIREILKYSSLPGFIPFSAGNPSAETFPIEKMRQISNDIFDKMGASSLQYGVTEGYIPLIAQVEKRLFEKFSIGRSFDRIIIVSGGQQGIDLSSLILCNPGDIVLCEEPTFIGSLNAFKSHGLKPVGIKMDNDGMNLEALENALKQNRNVRLLYIIPSFQNPLGSCTSFEKRRSIYELCLKYNCIILEDNPYGELRFDGEDIPTIKSIDEDGIVIYCGSFSKVFAPGIRIGFVCAPSPIISRLVVAKQTNDVHTNLFFQIMISEFITRYNFDSHIEDIRKVYLRKCRLMKDCMEKHFPAEVMRTNPQGGIFLWCTLPKGCSAYELAERCLDKKVAIVPGQAFSVNPDLAANSFRLNYSTPDDEDIILGIKAAGECINDLLKGR